MASSNINKLFSFEERYPFLYDVTVGGVPVYACLRDRVAGILRGVDGQASFAPSGKKGRVYPMRVLGTFIGLWRHRDARTLVFTSSVYRRDRGRNLAVEWLMERYPGVVAFEWPSRSEAFDGAYFKDPMRRSYVPLDGYLVLYKLHVLLHRGRMAQVERDVRERLERELRDAPEPADELQRAALAYVLEQLPKSCAQIAMSQEVFGRLFAGYRDVRTAVDFWGSGRENVFPVLRGAPKQVELQHGIITREHPGYVYPQFVGASDAPLFTRTILVYDEDSKRALTEGSIFSPNQVEVVGNPRIARYREVFGVEEHRRDLVLFTSQPYEQDGSGEGYYQAVIPELARFQKAMAADPEWRDCRLVVKLHPREHDAVAELYREKLPGVEVYSRSSELYDLLSRSRLHLTVSSTVLYEAEEFGVPTALVPYPGEDARTRFGWSLPIFIASKDGCPSTRLEE